MFRLESGEATVPVLSVPSFAKLPIKCDPWLTLKRLKRLMQQCLSGVGAVECLI